MSWDTERSHSSASDRLLPDAAREAVLRIAREALGHCVCGRAYDDPAAPHPALRESRGVFVTLTVDGALRGCIGNPYASAPLIEQVIHATEGAALRDPRFPSVAADELDEIEIEISVLSPMCPLQDVGEIEIGRHGLYVRQDFRSGLLLPKVATRFGWNAEAFLNRVCEKAGLPMDAWRKSDAQVWTFEAEVFAEERHHTGAS